MQNVWCTDMEKLAAIVKRVKVETPDIKTIYFLLVDDWKLQYVAGQYITVFIAGSKVPAGKAYSLSSAPHEKWMSITVKNVGGEYSRFLCNLKKGDKFTVSRAYGNFNPQTQKPIVALAAGVGISPIISVLKDQKAAAATPVPHLYYSNKSHHAIAHKKAAAASGAVVHHHITAEKAVPATMHKGRIVLDECVKAAEGALYMICGGVGFVRDMWQGLTERGIAPENITTETFFES